MLSRSKEVSLDLVTLRESAEMLSNRLSAEVLELIGNSKEASEVALVPNLSGWMLVRFKG